MRTEVWPEVVEQDHPKLKRVCYHNYLYSNLGALDGSLFTKRYLPPRDLTLSLYLVILHINNV